MSKQIPLGGKKGAGKYVIVDDDDYVELSKHKWCIATPGPYAVRRHKKGKKVWMHREIMQPLDGLMIDHVNGDGLDNRRCNLRICTAKENLRNRRKSPHTLYKGVHQISRKGWRAIIQADGRQWQVGLYRSAEEAAHAYDEEARKVFGEFAWLNFPR